MSLKSDALTDSILPDSELFGYASSFSVAPGETISCHVSGVGADMFSMRVVRLIHGITAPEGPGERQVDVPADIAGNYPLALHEAPIGSYVEIADPRRVLRDSRLMAIDLTLFPTLMDRPLQGVIGSWDTTTHQGFALVLVDGALQLLLGSADGRCAVALTNPLKTHRWYAVTAGFDLDRGVAWVEHVPIDSRGNRNFPGADDVAGERHQAPIDLTTVTCAAPFRMGALAASASHSEALDAVNWTTIAGAFNGKIGNPRITQGPGGPLLAEWEFATSPRDDGLLLQEVIETGPHHLDGRVVNAPARGVTAANWDGEATDYRVSSDQYGAIHFHEDDLVDARWPAAFEYAVPTDARSGIYAFRLEAAGHCEYVPFTIGPTRLSDSASGERRSARVALLLPTGSYLAYANDRLPFDAAGAELLIGHVPVVGLDDLELQRHYDFGRSCYELHPDGTGVVYSSRRRPIVNMRPDYRGWFMADGPWQFPADLCIVDWLEHLGIDFDVITDEDLHRDGHDLIADYAVLLTGSHPEYISTAEIEAIEQFVASGGNLMYLGGNGFYWRVAYDPERPYLMEVRRAANGSRPHTGWPGEHYLSVSGEHGGLWRNLGRPPQRLLGVGMGSEGFDRSSGYRRMPASFSETAAFIFEGVPEEVFGEFGLMGGGAAGAELDRFDVELGSPRDGLLLATSVRAHSDDYQQASEDLYETPPTTGGTQNPAVRSDVVYYEIDGGGAVFSTGSIAWTGALSINRYTNSVARITENVLRAFLTRGT